jgi:hypothetical protein
VLVPAKTRSRTARCPQKVRGLRDSDDRSSCAESVVFGFCVCPSPDYQPGDEGLLDECEIVVRSVDQVTRLTPAAEFEIGQRYRNHSCTTYSIVKTVSDDDSVLAGDATRATSADAASATAHRPILWDIRVVKSEVTDAPLDPDFDKCFDPDFDKNFALSGFSRVHQFGGSRCVRIRYRRQVSRKYRSSCDVYARPSHPRLHSNALR